jgi:hypothetical protein
MITDRRAYERWCEAERWERLRAMSLAESIAVGEALLTSEVMVHVTATPDVPRSVAIALGIVARHPPRSHGASS